jgi:hypothetical protein
MKKLPLFRTLLLFVQFISCKTLISLALIIFPYLAIGQTAFKQQELPLSRQNDERLKQYFKAYKTYEFSLAEIKTHIRKNKSNNNRPTQFILELDNDKINFNLFENDIFADSYYEIENGIKKTKDKIEINTYAGFVGDNSHNVLRLFISDDRLSGFFIYTQSIEICKPTVRGFSF